MVESGKTLRLANVLLNNWRLPAEFGAFCAVELSVNTRRIAATTVKRAKRFILIKFMIPSFAMVADWYPELISVRISRVKKISCKNFPE
jgi:hypothetical protein